MQKYKSTVCMCVCLRSCLRAFLLALLTKAHSAGAVRFSLSSPQSHPLVAPEKLGGVWSCLLQHPRACDGRRLFVSRLQGNFPFMTIGGYSVGTVGVALHSEFRAFLSPLLPPHPPTPAIIFLSSSRHFFSQNLDSCM